MVVGQNCLVAGGGPTNIGIAKCPKPEQSRLEPMASNILKGSMLMKSAVASLRIAAASRHYASVAVGADLVSAAPDVSLQKARTWDEGVSSKFSTTPLKDIFKVFLFRFPFFPWIPLLFFPL